MKITGEGRIVSCEVNLKAKALRLLFPLVLACLAASSAEAILNPDAVYCRALGYEYYSAHTARGVIGVCVLTDERIVNASDFYRGRVALEWSYCARQGYEAIPGPDCLRCVLQDGREIRVAELMGLNFREYSCGDERCSPTESYAHCPEDCPSGGTDGFCDGVTDGICDPDCVAFGEPDADCPSLFIDIKPGSCPNPINLKSKGVFPVAILGVPSLDATGAINPQTILLTRDGIEGAVSPMRLDYGDVGAPYLGTDYCGCGTAEGDGITDLTLKFDNRELVRTLELDEMEGETVQLIVTGSLNDGTAVEGRDCVKILK